MYGRINDEYISMNDKKSMKNMNSKRTILRNKIKAVVRIIMGSAAAELV